MKYLTILLTLYGISAQAQQVSGCYEGLVANEALQVMAVYEASGPLAGGKVWLLVTDTIRPPLRSNFLLVLFWPGPEALSEQRHCAVISDDGVGYPDIRLDGMREFIVEGQGEGFSVPLQYFDAEAGEMRWGNLDETTNRNRLMVTAEFVPEGG